MLTENSHRNENSFSKDNSQILSSRKSKNVTENAVPEPRKSRITPHHPELRIDPEWNNNNVNEVLSNRTRDYYNQSFVQPGQIANVSKFQITPKNQAIDLEKTLRSPVRSPISQANTIKIYNKILSTHSETQKASGPVEDKKLEIIQNNLMKLQKEHMLAAEQKRSARSKERTLESTLSLNTNSQVNSVKERLSRTSKNSNEIERLSTNYTLQPSSKGKTSASQESLMKSFLLRQNMRNPSLGSNRSPSHRETNGFESPKRNFPTQNVFQETLVANLSSQSRKHPEEEVYARNSEWLSNKKSRIDGLSHIKDKEEMKECTFRPQLFSKSTRNNMIPLYGGFTSNFMESRSPKASLGSKLRSQAAVESPRHASHILQTEPSSRKSSQLATYKQIHESRKNNNVFLDESLTTSLHKTAFVSSKK